MHVGIFGRTKCGKTTLAMQLSRAYWQRFARRSIVLDPMGYDWGGQAWITRDRAAFLDKVWRSRRCMVFVDEATITIARSADAEVADLFTRSANNEHCVHVIGHTSRALLPVMRDQLSELYLFRLSSKEAEDWADSFTDPRLMAAAGLDYEAREFLHARLGGFLERRRLELR